MYSNNETLRTKVEGRFYFLEGLRGICAQMVFLAHFNMVFGNQYPVEQLWSLEMVFNGHNAVSIFFILSGLVLSVSMFSRGSEFIPYVFRRIFRLYPAFILCLWVLFLVEKGDMHSYFREAVMLIPVQGNRHLLPGWTLPVELTMSLLVPFMVIIARKSAWLLLGFGIVLVFIFHVDAFLFHFIAGILLARVLIDRGLDFLKVFKRNTSMGKSVGPVVISGNRKWRWPFTGLIVLVFLASWTFEYLPILWRSSPVFIDSYTKHLLVFSINGISGIIVLAFILNNGLLRSYMGKSVPLFLGKISYSFYLIHYPCILLINGKILDKYSSYWQIDYMLKFILAWFFSILAACFIHIFWETPMIKAGTWLSRKFRL